MRGRSTWFLGIGMVLAVVLASASSWAVPPLINYQGMVTDKDGVPLHGTFTMRFYLYDALSGGTQLWDSPNGEEQSVSVTDGIYNVHLGSTVPLTDAVFTGDTVYLEVWIYNPDTSAWEPLSPRQRITSVAYALRAADADTLGGLDAAALDQSAHVTDMGNPHGVTPAQIGAATTSALSSHSANPSSHHTRYSNAEAVAAVKASDGAGSGLDADLLDGLNATQFAPSSHNHDSLYYSKAYVDQLQTRIAALETTVNELISRFQGVTRSGSDITFSGVNVRVVSGSGSTSGTVNGKGNLIIGYNEERVLGESVHSGSHNLIVGSEHNFSSYGGMVVGQRNSISDRYASVSGGHDNTASGSYSSVSGGWDNTASGYAASVSGGRYNKASGQWAFVGGGGGEDSTDGNEAFSHYSAILGGYRNVAGDKSVASHAMGVQSTVSGGSANVAKGNRSSIAGGQDNIASGGHATVSGGLANVASNYYSSVGGGTANLAEGSFASISGGWSNTASGYVSSVSGGRQNTADGASSTISGGSGRSVSGEYDWRAGGLFQEN